MVDRAPSLSAAPWRRSPSQCRRKERQAGRVRLCLVASSISFTRTLISRANQYTAGTGPAQPYCPFLSSFRLPAALCNRRNHGSATEQKGIACATAVQLKSESSLRALEEGKGERGKLIYDVRRRPYLSAWYSACCSVGKWQWGRKWEQEINNDQAAHVDDNNKQDNDRGQGQLQGWWRSSWPRRGRGDCLNRPERS